MFERNREVSCHLIRPRDLTNLCKRLSIADGMKHAGDDDDARVCVYIYIYIYILQHTYVMCV